MPPLISGVTDSAGRVVDEVRWVTVIGTAQVSVVPMRIIARVRSSVTTQSVSMYSWMPPGR